MRVLLAICLVLALAACESTSTIHTLPLGAEVFINGQRCGVSPCIYHDRYGFPDRMRVQIRAPGYQSAEFFVDTEPQLASFLLWGVGSYFFHSFAKEYRFTLAPLDATRAGEASRGLATGRALTDIELTSILEQCLYWGGQKTADVWTKRFFENAETIDCRLAESALLTYHAQEAGPKPVLARALIRYIAYRRSTNRAPVALPWSTEVLCNAAKVEYAKRVGAGPVPPVLPAFDLLCPAESRQLRNE